jgi:hypothetical protein
MREAALNRIGQSLPLAAATARRGRSAGGSRLRDYAAMEATGGRGAGVGHHPLSAIGTGREAG